MKYLLLGLLLMGCSAHRAQLPLPMTEGFRRAESNNQVIVQREIKKWNGKPSKYKLREYQKKEEQRDALLKKFEEEGKHVYWLEYEY